MHAVVFDIDGTLVQSTDVDNRLYTEAIQSVLGELRFRSNLHEYRSVTDSGILLQVMEENSIAAEPDLIRRIQHRFLSSFEAYFAANGPFEEIPGARRFVRRLRASEDHVVAFATGGWERTARLKLLTSGFDITDIPLASSDDAIERTEIMRLSLRDFDNCFESIVYYGDGIWDKNACESLGWTFCAVGRELGGIDSYADAAAAADNHRAGEQDNLT